MPRPKNIWTPILHENDEEKYITFGGKNSDPFYDDEDDEEDFITFTFDIYPRDVDTTGDPQDYLRLIKVEIEKLIKLREFIDMVIKFKENGVTIESDFGEDDFHSGDIMQSCLIRINIPKTHPLFAPLFEP